MIGLDAYLRPEAAVRGKFHKQAVEPLIFYLGHGTMRLIRGLFPRQR